MRKTMILPVVRAQNSYDIRRKIYGISRRFQKWHYDRV